MTYNVLTGMLNPTHSLAHPGACVTAFMHSAWRLSVASVADSHLK